MPSTIECLSCGQTRRPVRDTLQRVHMDDYCPRCGYVGWAPSSDLTESTRRALRDRPLRRRHLASIT